MWAGRKRDALAGPRRSPVEILKETEGLSQTQADWRPAEQEWSVGEILHHLTLAEVGTGKLTSKLFTRPITSSSCAR